MGSQSGVKHSGRLHGSNFDHVGGGEFQTEGAASEKKREKKKGEVQVFRSVLTCGIQTVVYTHKRKSKK